MVIAGKSSGIYPLANHRESLPLRVSFRAGAGLGEKHIFVTRLYSGGGATISRWYGPTPRSIRAFVASRRYSLSTITGRIQDDLKFDR
jgi:hypothetical protein